MLNLIPLTVASGAKNSTILTVGNGLLVSLYTDPNMTSTTVTFQGTPDNGVTWHRVSDAGSDGNALSYTFAAGDVIPLNPQSFAGLSQVIFTFGSSEGALRNIKAAVQI